MKRCATQGVRVLVALVSAGCQTGLPTELLVDDTTPEVAAVRPPPLSGGTLLVTRDGRTAVVSDPERDRVVVVDIATGTPHHVELHEADEPGRAVEGADGKVYVALRRGNAVVEIDVAGASSGSRRDVCSGPRGIAFDGSKAEIVVACASGELVTLAADAALTEVRRVIVAPDLRDVVVRPDGLLVTHFRSAQITKIDAEGAVLRASVPAAELADDGDVIRKPHVAWRALALPDGEVAMVHQTALSQMVDLEVPVEGDDTGMKTSAYAGECDQDLVHAELSIFDAQLEPRQVGAGSFIGLHLPIDLALREDGDRAVVIDPAANKVELVDLTAAPGQGCFSVDNAEELEGWSGTPIAAAFAGTDILVQTREPATLELFHGGKAVRTIVLGGDSRADTGFDLFHNTSAMNNTSGLACASCHPEGRDDGHVWTFSGEGLRRTQSLSGTLDGTAPFHWGGNLSSLGALMDEVSARRMGGVLQSEERVDALESWLLALEPLRAATSPDQDEEAIDRGRVLFESTTVGCSSCHSGAAFTNNETTTVGHGEALQVPSLVGVGMRGPFMHDGCAPTLIDRFDPACGGDEHGDTSGLDAAELEDLVAYMMSL
ncbi:MAG: cytochrome-c peroxidase [Polyangiaceae bacterium]|nr:cytochrome-c peroxidase [Polyangiaceae bacterium]